MSKISSLDINNFKFFDSQPSIKLEGKHLLLYGENGSGKSSIYWSLYTLFEAAIKTDDEEIKKYFRKGVNEEQSLVNIYAEKITDDIEHYDSYVEVITDDEPQKTYLISLKNQQIRGNPEAVEINAASDFINYKILFRLQNFWHGEPIDLADIFLADVLPYVRFAPNIINRAGVDNTLTNAFAMWKEIEAGPGKTRNPKGKEILVYKKSKEYKNFVAFKDKFNDSFKKLIEFININAPKLLMQLGYDIDFELSYNEADFEKKDTVYTVKRFSIGFKITKYLSKAIEIHRPQSFLNEAKITAISLAIRLTILRQRVNEEAGNILKFLVLDDLMISLDMNNRDTLIDFILSDSSKLTTDYQILFLTHDKNLFYFFSTKIKQKNSFSNWVFKEMYVGDGESKEYPIIIDSETEYLEKAKKYFNSKDYTSCSIYIRKELERLVIDRLPIEFTKVLENQYHNLAHLWKLCVERYERLNFPIDAGVKNNFEQTKLMLLNPQAHHNLSEPVYKVELEKAFSLIDDIKANYPIPDATILLTKGMRMRFKHPNENYSLDFELLSDFYIDGLNGATSTIVPKCRIITWQYNGTNFWDFQKQNTITLTKPIEHNLKQIKDTLVANVRVPLSISDDMFFENTYSLNGIWSLKEIISKSAAVI